MLYYKHIFGSINTFMGQLNCYENIKTKNGNGLQRSKLRTK